MCQRGVNDLEVAADVVVQLRSLHCSSMKKKKYIIIRIQQIKKIQT